MACSFHNLTKPDLLLPQPIITGTVCKRARAQGCEVRARFQTRSRALSAFFGGLEPAAAKRTGAGSSEGQARSRGRPCQ